MSSWGGKNAGVVASIGSIHSTDLFVAWKW